MAAGFAITLVRSGCSDDFGAVGIAGPVACAFVAVTRGLIETDPLDTASTCHLRRNQIRRRDRERAPKGHRDA